jgi:general secretion pathway protein C
MLDTRTTAWLSRFQADGPRAVAWVLGALIAVELARIAAALLSGQVKSPEPVVEASAPRPKPGVNVQAVVSAHLFGVVAVAGPNTQDPNNAPLSSANLALAGTIATENPKKGIAIISDGGPSKLFAVGDDVSGASLYSVYLDHVILDRAGNLETLLLPRLFAGGSRTAPRRAAAAADVRTAQTIQSVNSILHQVMRPVAAYDSAAGKFRGFRAYPGRNRAMFTELGLKPGDLVTAINGQPLEDAQHSEKVFNMSLTAASVTVTIERGGNRQDISLNVADIAGKAGQDLEGEKPGGAGATPDAPSGTPMGAPAAPSAPESNASETPNE